MLDWEGNPINKKDRPHFLLSEIEEDATIAVTSKIFIMEMWTVETFIDADHQDDGRTRPVFKLSTRKADQVYTVLTSISPTLDYAPLYDYLRDRAEMSKFKFSIGSTNGTTSQFLVDYDTKAT